MMRKRHSDGFTLIELLLVVVIAMLAAGIAMPAFVRSFQSSKLRTSARTIVMSSKYARSMAVLNQTQMAILFDKALGQVEVVSLSGVTGSGDRDRFLDSRETRATDELLDEGEEATSSGPILSDVVKTLPDGIRIRSFESDKEEQSYDDIYWVNYYANGMCDGFEMQLADKDDKTITIAVDSISGAVTVEYED